LWHHTSGCRAWVLVERDTATHEVHESKLARDDGGRQQ
jgi:sarcosine oxidase subunit delta